MANWCSNYILIDNKKVINCIKRLQKKEKQTERGQTLNYFNDDRYLFNIVINEENITWETKWSPPIETIKALAQKYNCDIEMYYDEPGMEIHGKCWVTDGEFYDVYLEQKDFDKIIYYEEEGLYLFENKMWESDSEIIDILLERKVKDNE